MGIKDLVPGFYWYRGVPTDHPDLYDGGRWQVIQVITYDEDDPTLPYIVVTGSASDFELFELHGLLGPRLDPPDGA